MERLDELEANLNDFDPGKRHQALQQLAVLARDGTADLAPESDLVNMHCHTFYSFNAYGYSPAYLAWLARRRGFRLVGIVDFDVLTGVDEFLAACQTVDMRGSTGIESRVFIPEYATQEINSPGEPGVCYHMGIGFTKSHTPTAVSGILADLQRRATQRNKAILQRVNEHLSPVAIDYERDVLPLSPGGNPTERHMVVAYVQAAKRTVDDPVAFWARRLDMESRQVAVSAGDSPAFQNLIRSKLMKRGGVGYVQPESGMFPALDDFHRLVVACGALPCAAWLDGTSAAELEIENWLAFLVGKGVVALNIIPDRNWNIAAPDTRALKVRNLYHVVEVAAQLDLPLNVGTEMNSFGQKLVDDLDASELAPVRQRFVDGAHFIYGHTVLQRALGLGYQSQWANSYLPARRERNEFYTAMGYRIPPGDQGLARLKELGPEVTPDQLAFALGGD